MSERDELVEYLRICGACHGCGIGADGDTCANCGDQRQPNRRAASLLERDGARIAELETEVARLRGEANTPSITASTIMALATIDAELGLPKDGCNSTARTLTAIRLLHSAHRDDIAEVARLKAELVEANSTTILRDQIDELMAQLSQCSRERVAALARAEAAAREAVAAWMIEHAFATGHGDTLTDLLAELSWQIAEIKRDAIKWRDTPIPVPPGECPYPVHADHSIKACVDAGDCGCGEDRK